jgi:hypothetical protein
VTTFPFSECLRYGNAGCCGISRLPGSGHDESDNAPQTA